MSRVADALRKASDPSLAADPGPPESIISVGGDDFTSVPWDFAPGPDRSPSMPPGHLQPRPFSGGSPRVIDDSLNPEYTDLVQRLFRPGSGEPTARAVLFIDMDPLGGGAHVPVDVARMLSAQDAGSVCVVDASFGSAEVHRQMDASSGPGFCDALLSSYPAASVAVMTGHDLWVVPAGGAMSDQPAWVPAAATRALRQLGSRFEFVIAAASVKGVSVATLMSLAQGCDGVVLVLDGDRTRRDNASTLLGRLRESGVSVFGAVLTKHKAPSTRQAGLDAVEERA